MPRSNLGSIVLLLIKAIKAFYNNYPILSWIAAGPVVRALAMTARAGRPCVRALAMTAKKPVIMRHAPTMTTKTTGFTLIEILVAVLIIGILAAIAIPQYQFSVEKTKAAQAFTILKALNDATERYYLTHGQYPALNDYDVLDITIPHTSVNSLNTLQTKYFLIRLRYENHLLGNHIEWPGCMLSTPYPGSAKGKYTCRYTDNNVRDKKLCEALCGTTDPSKFTEVNNSHYCWFNNWNI